MPEPQAKQIRDWLSQPAFQFFARWLAAKAAELAAEAGNYMVAGEEADVLEAERKAAEARRYVAAFEIMTQFLDRTDLPDEPRLLPRPMTK